MTGWSRLGDSFLLILDILLIAALVLLVPPSFIRSAQAAEWYFYVKNDGSWLKFNLNGGTGAGKNVQLDWAASTISHYCNQLVRATFADGSVSGPTRSGH